MLRIAKLDHIVLNVADIDESLRFYADVLGLQPERVDDFRAGRIRFPSVRVNQDTIIDLFPLDRQASPAGLTENLNHFCLVWEEQDVDGAIDYLRQNGVETERPPSHAWGAQGRGTSIRVRDPDGNLVELRVYAPETIVQVSP
ncbi:MAG TPA: VOC family protein [Dehalococcoidia bacterium]|nr:VOC family protein [Dehalococcoidia bacterium]